RKDAQIKIRAQRIELEEIEYHVLGALGDAIAWDENSFGMDNNFIQLGGDSISAMRLAWISRDRGIPLTVADILTKDRIAGLLLEERAGYVYEREQMPCISSDTADPNAC
ncbi:putative secondary metabolism biosynthetic enzyme, partial [Metarhizium acridum]